MTDTSVQRREIINEMRSCMGSHIFDIIRNDELRYEIRVRSHEGSYIMLCLDKNAIGDWGKITLEINCYTRLTGKPYSIMRRFFSYEDALSYFMDHKSIIQSIIHLFIKFEEEAHLLEKS
ncbi:MAG: hypothetical protein ACRC9L_04995 [Brevinema sp.]